MTDATACAFGKAVAAGQGRCPLVTLRAVAEAERPCCTSPVAQTNCRTLHDLLRERSTFALRLPPPGTPLAHAAELRLQCGGLRGLAEAMDEPEGPATDIHALVARARERWGSLLDLPFEALVASVVRWEARPRAGTRPGPRP